MAMLIFPEALSSADRLPALTEGLLRHGWTADEVHAAYGENFLRVLGQVQATRGPGELPEAGPPGA